LLVSTTTFRLAIAQASFFTIFAFFLLGYLFFTTAGQLTREAEAVADSEFAALEQSYAAGGLSRLNQQVIERMSSGGRMLYLLTDQDGVVITGSFSALPLVPAAESQRLRFRYERLNERGEVVQGRARGRVGRLLNGPILLVASDMTSDDRMLGRITGSIWTGGLLGLLLSLAAGAFAARQAARRAEALRRTTRNVMAGNLASRAHVAGVGDEFDSLARDLNSMLERLQRLVQSTRTAGDAIAHDLRTPLARMQANLEASLRHPPDLEADREALRKSLEESERLLETFNKIFRLSRAMNPDNWRLEPVDLTAIVEEIVEFYEPMAEEGELSITATIAPKVVVTGDRSLLTQALSNLVENALKYSEPGGKLAVRLERGSADVRLVVADAGRGIPAAERERVLERFYRVEEARSTPGLGLGLSLVAAIAQLHKGDFRFEDGIGETPENPGVTAVFTLPAA
jgi:signal transduction histidine kinase